MPEDRGCCPSGRGTASVSSVAISLTSSREYWLLQVRHTQEPTAYCIAGVLRISVRIALSLQHQAGIRGQNPNQGMTGSQVHLGIPHGPIGAALQTACNTLISISYYADNPSLSRCSHSMFTHATQNFDKILPVYHPGRLHPAGSIILAQHACDAAFIFLNKLLLG